MAEPSASCGPPSPSLKLGGRKRHYTASIIISVRNSGSNYVRFFRLAMNDIGEQVAVSHNMPPTAAAVLKRLLEKREEAPETRAMAPTSERSEHMSTGRHDKLHALIRNLPDPGHETPPIDGAHIAAAHGISIISIHSDPTENAVAGKLVIHGDQRVNAVNQTHHAYRRRFTIAHELGHYFVHRSHASVFVNAAYARDTISSGGLVRRNEAPGNCRNHIRR